MRVIAFIDGFNLYHAIRTLGDSRLKWCDVRKLMRLFLRPADKLAAVRFYTAFPQHLNAGIQRRFTAYTDALAAAGVDIIRGHFKKNRKSVKLGGIQLKTRADDGFAAKAAVRAAAAALRIFGRLRGVHQTFEEKETDVNIALDMIDAAHRGGFDKCFLVSGDSDLLPAIKMLLTRFGGKRVVVLLPPGQKFYAARNLSRQTPNRRLIVRDIYARAHIAKCRLPDDIKAANGARILSPADYR